MGHLKMVQQYAQRPDVDKVIVLISSPLKNQRTLKDGTVVTAQHSAEVWNLLLDTIDSSKIDLRISQQPSSVRATYDIIGTDGPLNPSDKVILGASDKPDDGGIPDWHRWLSVKPKDLKSG